MKRWIALVLIAAAAIAILSSQTATAQVTALRINIQNSDEIRANIKPGASFQVRFTLNVPAGMTIPLASKFYPSLYYFVGDEVKYPAEAYWNVPGGGVYYDPTTTEYTLNGKMVANAPVGQEIFVGVYWTIPASLPDSAVAWKDNLEALAVDNSLTIRISENDYTHSIVNIREITPERTDYYIVDESGWDVYLRTDKSGELCVRALLSGVEILPAGGGIDLTTLVIIAIVSILVVIIVVVVKKRREVPPAPPPPIPTPPPSPPPSPPPESPPESPPSPPPAEPLPD